MSLRGYSADSLRAISPASLSAYARRWGWEKAEPYGAHSDVYVAPDLPEVILPRTRRLADYADVAARLIRMFAETADMDESDASRIDDCRPRRDTRAGIGRPHRNSDGRYRAHRWRQRHDFRRRALAIRTKGCLSRTPSAGSRGLPEEGSPRERGAGQLGRYAAATCSSADRGRLRLPLGGGRAGSVRQNSNEWLEDEPIERQDHLATGRCTRGDSRSDGGDHRRRRRCVRQRDFERRKRQSLQGARGHDGTLRGVGLELDMGANAARTNRRHSGSVRVHPRRFLHPTGSGPRLAGTERANKRAADRDHRGSQAPRSRSCTWDAIGWRSASGCRTSDAARLPTCH